MLSIKNKNADTKKTKLLSDLMHRFGGLPHTALHVVLCRLFLRALYNTVHPAAVPESAGMDEVDSETYRSNMQHWNLIHPRANKLLLCADNPGVEPSAASVVS